MKTLFIAVVIMVIAAAAVGLYYMLMLTGPGQACVNSGGTVTTSMCCLSSGDFPNTCLIGACGCSLDNSHEVSFCDCGEGKCWDGNACV